MNPSLLRSVVGTLAALAALLCEATLHAQNWTVVNFHPAGAAGSEISAITGTQQAGWAIVGHYHAALWTGSAASFVDLHPAGASSSFIHAITGTRQAGRASIGGENHAALWAGHADSFVDLHPAGSVESQIHALSGNQQAGFAYIGGQAHAALWSGTAASFVDLHPAGATASEIYAITGTRQAGSVLVAGYDHAALWSGTTASFVDLHAYLPAHHSSSVATSIWTDGSTLLVGGYARNNSTARYEAILWRYTPPRAPTLSIKGKKRITTSRPSLVVKGRAADADGNLAKVEVKAGKAKFKRAKGLANWRFTARLRPGKNPVTARATDTTGRKSRNAKITIVRR